MHPALKNIVERIVAELEDLQPLTERNSELPFEEYTGAPGLPVLMENLDDYVNDNHAHLERVCGDGIGNLWIGIQHLATILYNDQLPSNENGFSIGSILPFNQVADLLNYHKQQAITHFQKYLEMN